MNSFEENSTLVFFMEMIDEGRIINLTK